jgi:hypothetical protein
VKKSQQHSHPQNQPAGHLARRKRYDENDDYNSIGKVLTVPLQHLTLNSEKEKILLDEEVGQRGKGPATPHVLPDMKGILLGKEGLDDTVRF